MNTQSPTQNKPTNVQEAPQLQQNLSSLVEIKEGKRKGREKM